MCWRNRSTVKAGSRADRGFSARPVMNVAKVLKSITPTLAKDMVNIAPNSGSLATVFPSLFAGSIYETSARAWGWKVFGRSVFLATRPQKPQPACLDEYFFIAC
jgi:hypothetical protein